MLYVRNKKIESAGDILVNEFTNPPERRSAEALSSSLLKELREYVALIPGADWCEVRQILLEALLAARAEAEKEGYEKGRAKYRDEVIDLALSGDTPVLNEFYERGLRKGQEQMRERAISLAVEHYKHYGADEYGNGGRHASHAIAEVIRALPVEEEK